ncbi:hypothetical protein EVAR_55354_1 [Eumeta japonica]|uniref:Uncharacterized protein n=1 Tax=Eumeta variegata TaxID=151549 RepID=A0A4C1YSP0_EUMVA|nr:hypothetical protein EVAR_55354_1 [Eumeta japonica]
MVSNELGKHETVQVTALTTHISTLQADIPPLNHCRVIDERARRADGPRRPPPSGQPATSPRSSISQVLDLMKLYYDIKTTIIILLIRAMGVAILAWLLCQASFTLPLLRGRL